VESKVRGKALVTSVDDDGITFVTAHQRDPERFRLQQTPRGWLLINATRTAARLPYEKVHYQPVEEKDVEKLFTPKNLVTAKIDGSAQMYELLGDKIESLSLRTSKATGRPIVHTERIGNPKLRSKLRETILLGEMYGVRNGQAIPAAELGGLLNSTVALSLMRQKERDIKLRHAVYDILKHEGKDVRKLPYQERLKRMRQVLEQMPEQFHLPEGYTDPAEQRALWERIRTGQDPITREGIVAHPLLAVGAVPFKAKTFPESDVIIKGIVPGEGRLKGAGAGGFYYALPDDPERIVGKVGTGFNDEDRWDMWRNPGEWIGRTARIRAQEQFPSGAYRAPGFIARHEDVAQKQAAAEAESIHMPFPDIAKGNVLDGSKTLTIRTNEELGKYKPGQQVIVGDYAGNSWGVPAVITSVERLQAKNLAGVGVKRKATDPSGWKYDIPPNAVVDVVRFNIQKPLLSEDVTQKEAGLSREDIVAQLKAYGHPRMGVSAGSAMTLHGLRDSTADIDAEVPTEVFDELHKKHGSPPLAKSKMGDRMYRIPGSDIDLFDSWDEGYEAVPDVNALVATKPALLAFYRKLNRPKDQPWIQALEQEQKSALDSCDLAKEAADDGHKWGWLAVRLPSALQSKVPQKVAVYLGGYRDKQAAAIDEAAKDTDTAPTEAQKKSGNYAKGKVSWQGLPLSIENPAGSTRSGTSAAGKKWSTQMRHHYGYILGSKGRDKDHVDVFVKPNTDSGFMVYVVNQVRPATGAFDEHKCMLGFATKAEAEQAYLANYEKGWKGLGSIVPMPLPKFKQWALSDEPAKGELISAAVVAFNKKAFEESSQGVVPMIRSQELKQCLEKAAAEVAQVQEEEAKKRQCPTFGQKLLRGGLATAAGGAAGLLGGGALGAYKGRQWAEDVPRQLPVVAEKLQKMTPATAKDRADTERSIQDLNDMVPAIQGSLRAGGKLGGAALGAGGGALLGLALYLAFRRTNG
jgi:hypothetical protein